MASKNSYNDNEDMKGLSKYEDDDDDIEYSTEAEQIKSDNTNMFAYEIRQETLNAVKYLLISLMLLFFSCLWTLRDSFWCTGGTDQDCEDIRKNLSCKSKVVSPMWSTMSLIIGPGDTKVDVGVFCGWETASS